MSNKAIDCLDFCVIDNSLWMISGNFNALLKYDNKHNTVEFVSFFPLEIMTLKYGYYRILNYEKKLICVPQFSNSIVIYDTETASFERSDDLVFEGGGRFADACIRDNRLYCIPTDSSRNMLVIDLKSLKIIDRCRIEVSENYGFNRCYFYKDNIYLNVPGKDIVVDININKMNNTVFSVGEDGEYSAITGYDEMLFLQDSKGERLLKYDLANNSVSGIVKDGEKSHEICAIDKNRVLVGSIEYPLKMVSFENQSAAIIGERANKYILESKFVNGSFRNQDEKVYYFDRLSSSVLIYTNIDLIQTEIGLEQSDRNIIMREILKGQDNPMLLETNLLGVGEFVRGMK